MTALVLHFPFPPSTNRLWRHQGGNHHKSARYQTWQRAAENELQVQLVGKSRPIFTGNVAIDMRISASSGRRGPRPDLDNLAKGIIDTLAHMAVFENDRQVADLRMRWADVEGAVVTVQPVDA